MMGGVSCVHARVSGGAPTLSATVEGLDISEGVEGTMENHPAATSHPS